MKRPESRQGESLGRQEKGSVKQAKLAEANTVVFWSCWLPCRGTNPSWRSDGKVCEPRSSSPIPSCMMYVMKFSYGKY